MLAVLFIIAILSTLQTDSQTPKTQRHLLNNFRIIFQAEYLLQRLAGYSPDNCPFHMGMQLGYISQPPFRVPDNDMWAEVMDTSSLLPGPAPKPPTQSCTPLSPICQVDSNAQGNLGSHMYQTAENRLTQVPVE